MNYLKTILKWIVNILSGIVLVILAMVVYGRGTAVFSDHGYPNYFGYTFFSVASGSMEPALYVDDVILVRITQDDIALGDIITYVKNDEIITHRIIDISETSITVKGDHNNTIDAPIARDVVIGKVVKIFPKLSIWQKVLTEPKIIIALFITLLLFDFAISYKGKDKNKDNEKDKVKERTEKVEKPKETEKKEKLEETNKKEKSNKLQEIINKFKQVKSNKKDKKVEKKEPVKEEKTVVKEEEKKEENTSSEVKVVKVEDENKKDNLESSELLEVTRTINLEDIEKLLNDNEDLVINKEKKTVRVKRPSNNVEEKKEDEVKSDYTVRLDLNEIQRRIRDKVK